MHDRFARINERDIKLAGLPDLKGYLITLSMVCSCEAKTTLLVAASVGTMFGCGACRKVWRIEGFVLNSKLDVIDIDLVPVAVPMPPQKEV